MHGGGRRERRDDLLDHFRTEACGRTLDDVLHTTSTDYANPFDHAGSEPPHIDLGARVTEQRDDSYRFQRRVSTELFAYCPCLSVRLSDVFIPTSSVLTELPVPDLHGSGGVLRLDREDATRTHRDVVDVAIPSKRYIVEHVVTASHQRVEDGADPLLAFSSDAKRLRAPSSPGCLRREG